MVLGVYNSVSTLGRFIGTMLTGVLFTFIYFNAPLFGAAILMMIVFLFASVVQRGWKDRPDNVAAKAESVINNCTAVGDFWSVSRLPLL